LHGWANAEKIEHYTLVIAYLASELIFTCSRQTKCIPNSAVNACFVDLICSQ